MCTAEGGRKACGLVREAGWGVDCRGGQEEMCTAEGGIQRCELVWETGMGVD